MHFHRPKASFEGRLINCYVTLNYMRRSRYHRNPTTLPLRLTYRDVEILKCIDRFKYLTSQQIADLFNSSRQGINKRLKLLFHHHYLGKLPARLSPHLFNSPDVYFINLNRKTSRALAVKNITLPHQKRSNHKTPKRDYIQHTLLTNECLIAFERTVGDHREIEFLPSHKLLNEPSMKKVQNRSHPWKVSAFISERHITRTAFPDAAFALLNKKTGKKQLYLIEADRMTQPLARRRQKLFRVSNIKAKLIIYHTAWKQGVFREQFGFPATRILFITLSAERAKHMRTLATALFGKKTPGLFVFTDTNSLSPESCLLGNVLNI